MYPLSGRAQHFSIAAGKADTVVPTIENIMPYGTDYRLFKGYLDMAADYAKACVKDDGTPIPILYRT